MKNFLFLIFITVAIILPSNSFALSVSPAIIDVDANPKDTYTHKLTLKNTEGGVAIAQVYAFVRDIDPQTGVAIDQSDPSHNLGNALSQWIEVTHGVVDMQPGESKEIDLTVRVNLAAIPGKYHAVVSFVNGASRDDAQSRINSGAQIIVNANITASITEDAQINKFAVPHSIALGKATSFGIKITNVGNHSIAPTGTIRITDKRGREVAVLKVNPDGKHIESGKQVAFDVPWQYGTWAFGKYKAHLDLQYGTIRRGDLTDTVFVTTIPIPVFIGFISGLGIVALLLHRRSVAKKRELIRSVLMRARTKQQILGILISILAISPSIAFAESTLALSITPPIINLSMKPGDYWASELRIVNTNKTPLTVTATSTGFVPTGDAGQGTFVPDMRYQVGTLANWTNVDSMPITIEPNGTGSVHFEIRVPADAAPGGHYAAILVGTDAPQDSGSHIGIKSSVTSLLLVRIEGDVREEGYIREFTTSSAVSAIGTTTVRVRFENAGNVHLQPRGFVTIKNMWGNEIASLPINNGEVFGNVLPASGREFEAMWAHKQHWYDVGLYTADIVLNYGSGNKKSVTASIRFWFLPWREIGTVCVIAIGGLLIALALIRMYVRSVVSRYRE